MRLVKSRQPLEKQDTANDGADSEKADSNADAQDTNTEDSSQEGAE